MSKVIAANEACKIGANYREQRKEETFLKIMDRIGGQAKYSTSVILKDMARGSQRYDDDLVQFLQDHPDQVERLRNMGYVVELTVEDVETTWTEDESYVVRRGLFGYGPPRTEYRKVKREKLIEVRSYEISWECEECDGRDKETI